MGWGTCERALKLHQSREDLTGKAKAKTGIGKSDLPGVCPEKLVCSVGDRPTKVKVRDLVAGRAEKREIEFLMPIDKAIFKDGEQVIGP